MARKQPNLTQEQKAEMFDLQQKWQSLTDAMKVLIKDSKPYKTLKKERTQVTNKMKEIRESSK
ncbi:hypothetical protein [Bernardetia sp. MNP-M8]|uniref:hypothetical protein n=1 Tax=Bernardetia sp. MNP-M8 TaxID=3127470 RepID=UPI0030D28AF8